MGDRQVSILVDSHLQVCATLMGEFDSQQTYINELNSSHWTIWLDKPNSVFDLLHWSVLVWSFLSWIPSLDFCNLVFQRSSSCEQCIWYPSEHFDKNVRYIKQFWINSILFNINVLLCTRFTEVLGLLWNLLEWIVDKRSNLLGEQTPEYHVGKQKLYFSMVYPHWATFYTQDY